jgi:hypothetical protein
VEEEGGQQDQVLREEEVMECRKGADGDVELSQTDIRYRNEGDQDAMLTIKLTTTCCSVVISTQPAYGIEKQALPASLEFDEGADHGRSLRLQAKLPFPHRQSERMVQLDFPRA